MVFRLVADASAVPDAVRWDARILALYPESVHGYRPWASADAESWAAAPEWSLQRQALLRLAAGPAAAVELVAALLAAAAALAGLVGANLAVAHPAAVLPVWAHPDPAWCPAQEQQQASQPPAHSEPQALAPLVLVPLVCQPQEP